MHGMNIVDKAITRTGGQNKLSAKLKLLTGHPYKQAHVAYWKANGQFPADLANIVASEIFGNEITAFEACPSIKRLVSNG